MALRHSLLISLLAWLAVVFPSFSQAQSPSAPPLVFLAKHERWQALLHWNQGSTLRNRNKSYVADDDFFLSPHGKTNALKELEATVAALEPAESPMRCRFPARYRFLAEQLGWPMAEAFDHCEEYRAWREQVPDNQAVLVFPAAYLNSPSSMFGHTLLRLDAADVEQQGSWLSWAVNFGAVVDDEASMLYIYRGLAGSYPGYFSTVPYHTKIQEYAHLENRDMWEYPLNLDHEEMQWLIDHLWELQDIRFDYYFLDENCSFRLLELMEVARPNSGLLTQFRFTEIPVDTVRTLIEADFVTTEHYRPSKAVELKTLSDSLTVEQRRLAKRLAKTPKYEGEDFTQLTPSEQRRTLKAAYELLRYSQRKKERDAEAARKSIQLLRRLSAYEKEVNIKPWRPEPPESGHGTKMFAVSGGAHEGRGYGQLEYRWTYHDWFDPPRGFLQGAQIEAFRTKLRYNRENQLKLEELGIVDIRSLATRDAFLKPISWYVRGGLERTAVEGDYATATYLEAGPGLSWEWRGLRPYTFATARVEHHSRHQQFIEPGAGVTLGALWYAPKDWVLGASVESLYFARESLRHQAAFTLNVPIATQQALRFEAKHQTWRKGHGDTEVGMSWRYYFH